MTTKAKGSYTGSDAKHLGYRDSVRTHTTMYLGELGEACAWTVCREALDNTVDEALGGHVTHTEFVIDEDGSYWVIDNGRGMPISPMEVEDPITGKKSKVPALQGITSLLHAGAKGKDSKAYAVSRGVHGIGIKGTNFTSKFFEVWTCPPEGWHYIGYKDGRIDGSIKKVKAPEHPALNRKLTKGTLIHFKPDPKVVGAEKFPVAYLSDWAKIAAYFTPDLKITATLANGKTRTWHFPEGPQRYLKDRIEELKIEAVQGKPFMVVNHLVSCVVAFTGHDSCELTALTNGLKNPGRGKHFDAFFDALTSAIEPYRKARQKFTPSDMRDGVVGLVNVNLSAPAFGGQTKEKLVDDRAGKPLKEMLQAALVKYFKENKSTAVWICERAQAMNELKGKFVAGKKVLGALKKKRKGGLPAKAQIAPNCKPEQRELFLIEGDSAGGTTKMARDPKYQENLPLKGKILNAAKSKDLDSVLLSEEVMNILTMIGYDPSQEDPLSKLRVGKIILLSDPDPDGPLHPDTLIPVFNGQKWDNVSIKELHDTPEAIGCKVISYKKGAPNDRKLCRVDGIVEVTLPAHEQEVAITWADGTKTVCSTNHRWVTARPETPGCIRRTVNFLGQEPHDGELQFLRADSLKAGDMILGVPLGDVHVQHILNPRTSLVNKPMMVAKVHVRKQDMERKFYCLNVPESHNFMLANGVFSGNCHINSLELGLFGRTMPGLFDRGTVYVADAPEFYAKVGKDFIFGDSTKELRAKLEKLGASKKTELHHVKGWGELPAPLLARLAYNPETRRLRQVTASSSSLRKFISLMGDDSEVRRELMGI